MVNTAFEKYFPELFEEISKKEIFSSKEELTQLFKSYLFKRVEDVLFSLDSKYYKSFGVQPTQPATPEVIKELQDMAIPTMFFTGRLWFQHKRTVGELNSIGITSDKNTVFDKELIKECKNGKNGFGFYKGMLLVIECPDSIEKTQKGPILYDFLQKLPEHPEKVIFIDDSERNIKSVYETLKDSDLKDIEVIWYKAALPKSKELNEEEMNFIKDVWGENWWEMKVNVDDAVRVILKHLEKIKTVAEIYLPIKYRPQLAFLG